MYTVRLDDTNRLHTHTIHFTSPNPANNLFPKAGDVKGAKKEDAYINTISRETGGIMNEGKEKL